MLCIVNKVIPAKSSYDRGAFKGKPRGRPARIEKEIGTSPKSDFHHDLDAAPESLWIENKSAL